jgi:hypothetical protein
VDRLSAKEDDAGIGNCNEDTEKRDNTGAPYMLEEDPEAGLVEDIDSKELVAPPWAIPLPSDASDVVEVGKMLGLDTEGDDRENIIDDDGRSLSCAAVDLSKAAGRERVVSELGLGIIKKKLYLQRPFSDYCHPHRYNEPSFFSAVGSGGRQRM